MSSRITLTRITIHALLQIINIIKGALLLVVILVDIVFCVDQSISFPVLYKYPLGDLILLYNKEG